MSLKQKFFESILEAIKDESHYSWHEYNHPESISLSYRGTEHPLHKGDRFGIRHAKSTPDKKRIVMAKHGVSKVFSLPHDASNFLISRSRKV